MITARLEKFIITANAGFRCLSAARGSPATCRPDPCQHRYSLPLSPVGQRNIFVHHETTENTALLYAGLRSSVTASRCAGLAFTGVFTAGRATFYPNTPESCPLCVQQGPSLRRRRPAFHSCWRSRQAAAHQEVELKDKGRYNTQAGLPVLLRRPCAQQRSPCTGCRGRDRQF